MKTMKLILGMACLLAISVSCNSSSGNDATKENYNKDEQVISESENLIISSVYMQGQLPKANTLYIARSADELRALVTPRDGFELPEIDFTEKALLMVNVQTTSGIGCIYADVHKGDGEGYIFSVYTQLNEASVCENRIVAVLVPQTVTNVTTDIRQGHKKPDEEDWESNRIKIKENGLLTSILPISGSELESENWLPEENKLYIVHSARELKELLLVDRNPDVDFSKNNLYLIMIKTNKVIASVDVGLYPYGTDNSMFISDVVLSDATAFDSLLVAVLGQKLPEGITVEHRHTVFN